MLFIDYIPLMMANMAAGLVLLGIYSIWGLDKPQQSQWAAGFAAVGLVGVATGLHMALTWPLPRLEQANLMWANILFGEPTVLLGALFLALALATGKNWSLTGIAPLALLWGGFAVAMGVCAMRLGLTQAPQMTGIAFILTGTGGVLLSPAMAMVRKPGSHRALRIVAGALLIAAAGLFYLAMLNATYMHLQRYSQL